MQLQHNQQQTVRLTVSIKIMLQVLQVKVTFGLTLMTVTKFILDVQVLGLQHKIQGLLKLYQMLPMQMQKQMVK